MMKKTLAMLLAATTIFSLAACTNGNSSSSESSSGGDKPQEIALQRMFSPVVKVSKSGTASWTSLDNATEFVYKINGGEEVKTSERSVKLNENDKIEVKCLGDGTLRRDSRWSDVQSYAGAHSFVWDNNGQPLNSVNIYKPDGTVVLDTIGSTKVQGDVLKTGEEYIFEVDLSIGSYHGGLMLAGIDNAVLSDLTWTDSQYPAREGEKSESDTFHEVLYNTKYNIYPDYPEIHRLDWNTYWGEATYGWNMKSEPLANENGVYDTRKEDIWTVEPNWCSTLYGQHVIGSSKSTRGQMETKGYKYVRFKLKYDKFNFMGTGCVDGSEEFGALLGREDFNLFIKCHTIVSTVTFDSLQGKEYTARDYSMATDDNGKAAAGVNIYDAASGDVVLGAMTDSGAQGKLLEANKKYIFEFDTTGQKDGPVAFTGVQNAILSDVTWSDKLYSERTGESAVADDLGFLNLDLHYLKEDEPLFHRISKSADGYKVNYLRTNILTDGEVDTAQQVGSNGGFQRCLMFAKKEWFASMKTPKQADRRYFRMAVEFREIQTIDVGAAVTDENDENYGRLAATYFNMFVYTPAGGRYLYLTAYAPD